MSSSQPLVKQVMRVKNPDHIVEEADHGGLKRSMGLVALLMFSVGSIIGTGIFVILGEAIPKAGPAAGSFRSAVPRTRRTTATSSSASSRCRAGAMQTSW